MKLLHNESRIETTANFIANELKILLDRMNFESFISKRLHDGCPTYKNLTNEERALATLRALALTQIEVTRDIASMTIESDDLDDLDDDEAA